MKQVENVSETEFTKVFGNRLRMLRSVRGGISQKDFALELGIPQPTLSAYESGRIKPTIGVVIYIAEKCGVSADWLCGRGGNIDVNNMGDVQALLFELYETKDVLIHTTVKEDCVELKIYREESSDGPVGVLTNALCDAVEEASGLTQALRRYEYPQEMYEREKTYFINKFSELPVEKIDHTGITDEECRKKRLELVKTELKSLNDVT